jgi:hypothetical protein
MISRRLAVITCGLALGGCVYGVHQQGVVPRAALATEPTAALTVYAAPADEYPTIGGNVLAGTSPEVQAAARAAAIRPPEPENPQ